MYTIVTEPENLARHAREYQLLLDPGLRVANMNLDLIKSMAGIRWIPSPI